LILLLVIVTLVLIRELERLEVVLPALGVLIWIEL
jgi:hypothetical protein